MSELITTKLSEENLTVYLSGRLDSSNASEADAAISDAIKENPKSVIVDMEKLDYISSAGLRVILRIRKANENLKVINVKPDVYDILDMTGFTEMIKVEKAYRVLSVEGCEVIGQGANGKVYRLDPDTVVKVYFNPDALPEIHRERELARKAFVLGIPTAIPYDVARVGEGYGSVFELLDSASFSKLIKNNPDKYDFYIHQYVDLLKLIHGTETKLGEMPDMKETVIKWVTFLKDYLSEEQSSKLISMVEAVPVSTHVMHGDYHMKNVVMQKGEVLIIDMDTLALGHPVFEFASIFLAYQAFLELDHSESERFLNLPYDVCCRIWDDTVRLYLDTDDEALIQSVKEKSMIVGYARLMRRTIRRDGFETENGRAQIECCKKHLAELLEKVDTLVF